MVSLRLYLTDPLEDKAEGRSLAGLILVWISWTCHMSTAEPELATDASACFPQGYSRLYQQSSAMQCRRTARDTTGTNEGGAEYERCASFLQDVWGEDVQGV